MVKRFEWRRYGFLAFALMVMILCWENEKSGAAFASEGIPEDSIRLRILANSDTLEDQAVKHLLRDRIVEQMNAWLAEPQSIDAARAMIESRIPELQELAERTLEERGLAYDAQVELGKVPFPTKMYGSRVYPAGEYEALRVTLGRGEGQNWWCVLFPPLCFVDAVTGEAKAADKAGDRTTEQTVEKAAAAKGKTAVKAGGHQTDSIKGSGKPGGPAGENTGLQVKSKAEVHFFVWDAAKSFFSWVRGLFA